MRTDIAIIIPARLGSTRLPGKPLIKIGKKRLIEHVIANLQEKYRELLYVATDSVEIASIVEGMGVSAIMTEEECPSGSDRVFQAFTKIPNRENINFIINIQGDMPFIQPAVVDSIIGLITQSDFDIVTSAVKVGSDIASKVSNVKVVIDKNQKALYFSRSKIPYGANEFLYHIGIYGYKKHALERFISLGQSIYENSEQLEQLRAIEDGMSIGVCLVDEIPISVDTVSDLQIAKKYDRDSGKKLA